jgi:hypothetical protein
MPFKIEITTLFVMALPFLISCTTTNPYNLAEGEGAHLRNRVEIKGNSKYVYIFDSAITSEGWKYLDPGLIADDPVEERIYKIPTGVITLGLSILYAPNAGPDLTVGGAVALSFQVLYSSEARSRYEDIVNPYEILVVNPKEKTSGLEGIKINALQGYTYQIACEIENGKAYIWIEDDTGNKVSETVRGIGASYPNYWLWEDLPQPAP